MTEAKHTPADWDVNEFDDLEGDHHITVVFKSNGCPIAHLYENGYQTRPNARLIAAAPELLASVRMLMTAIENIGGEHVTGLEGINCVMDTAQAVIAKATGEQA